MTRLFIMISLTLFISTSQAQAASGKASIRGTTEGSTLAGEVLIQEMGSSLRIWAEISNAPPGKHGFHVHQNGSCEDGGKAAGGHFNPKEAPHGFLLKDGLEKAHAGDLGNITISENGTGNLEIYSSALKLTDEEMGIANRAFILHADEDDFGQPTGNAGARIGCGIISIDEA